MPSAVNAGSPAPIEPSQPIVSQSANEIGTESRALLLFSRPWMISSQSKARTRKEKIINAYTVYTIQLLGLAQPGTAPYSASDIQDDGTKAEKQANFFADFKSPKYFCAKLS